MLTCPLCQKEIDPPAATCPRCRADLALLADHIDEVHAYLSRDGDHPNALATAVSLRTYLEAHAADPTNAEAKAALGPIMPLISTAGRSGVSYGDVVIAVVAALFTGLVLGFVCGTMFFGPRYGF